MSTNIIKEQFSFCAYVLNKVLDGISHELSLSSSGRAGNCINWILGHIVLTRNRTLKLVDKKQPYPDERFERYRKGSKPLSDTEQVIQLNDLIDAFKQTHLLYMEGITDLTDDVLEEKAPSGAGGDNDTLGSILTAIACHEAYHIGQIGLLRRLTGKPGAVG